LQTRYLIAAPAPLRKHDVGAARRRAAQRRQQISGNNNNMPWRQPRRVTSAKMLGYLVTAARRYDACKHDHGERADETTISATTYEAGREIKHGKRLPATGWACFAAKSIIGAEGVSIAGALA